MSNIYVNEKDPSKIVSIVDWQYTQVASLFIQVRWPYFLEPKSGHQTGLVMIERPEKFDSLNDDDKAIARYKYRENFATKIYKIWTFTDDREMHRSIITLPRCFRELFIRAGRSEKRSA